MTSGWMVYRCEEHRTTQYINANPQPGAVAPTLCCDESTLVGVADHSEFCAALRSTIPADAD